MDRDPCFLPKDLKQVKVATWNARGFFAVDSRMREKKLRYARRLVKKAHVLVILEAHGNEAQYESFKRDFARSHGIYYSLPSDQWAGGVLLMVDNDLLDKAEAAPTVEEVLASRVLAVDMEFSDGFLSFTGLHNFNFGSSERKVLDFIRGKFDKAQNSTGRNVAFVAGDFNFLASGDLPVRVSLDGSPVRPLANRLPRIQVARKWEEVLLRGTELAQNKLTRFATKSEDSQQLVLGARLDRVYCSLVPWQITQTRTKSFTIGIAEDAYEKVGSDHIGVLGCIALKVGIPRHLRPVPKWITRNDTFKEMLQVRLAELPPKADPFEEASEIKRIIRSTAGDAIKAVLARPPTDPAQRLQLVLQLARAIPSENHTLVVKILVVLPEIAEFVAVENGVINVRDASGLDNFTSGVASSFYQSEVSRAWRDGEDGKKKPSRAARAERLLSLWNPFRRRAITISIKRVDGTTTADRDESLAELAKSWAPTFAAKESDGNLTKALFHQYGNPLRCKDLRLPGSEMFSLFFKRAGHSAPGPDGIGYGGWAAVGPRGGKVMRRCLLQLTAGVTEPPEFNWSLGFFGAKGEAADDKPDYVTRLPSEVRTLSAKNTDNKCIAGVVNFSLAPVVASWAFRAQEGFIKGRQVINNIVEVDAWTRAADSEALAAAHPKIGRHPALVLCDIMAAFPSLNHAFLFSFLRFCDLPLGLYEYFLSLYRNNVCMAIGNKGLVVLFVILSGILQGCPLSGTLFAMSLDSFLRMICSVLPSSSTKAFADDLAIVIGQLKELPKLARCFEILHKTATLALKPSKCILIVLGAADGDGTKERAQAYVNHIVPQWSNFIHARRGRYLGAILGPEGGAAATWEAPLKKLEARVEQGTANTLGPSLCVPLINRHALTVTSYVEQFSDPPAHLAKLDLSISERALRLPHNTLPKLGASLLKEVNVTPVHSLAIRAEAARSRAALRTCSTWQKACELLDRVRREHGPMINAARDPEKMQEFGWWKGRAYADTLREAANHAPLKEVEKGQSLQREIYKRLLLLRTPSTLAGMIAKKLEHFFGDSVDYETRLKEVEANFAVVSELPPSFALAWVRSCCNGWVTSCRFGSNKLKCVFGCGEGVDNVRHYSACGVLHKWCAEAVEQRNIMTVENGAAGFFGLATRIGTVADSGMHDLRKDLIIMNALKVEVYNTFSHMDAFRVPLTADSEDSSSSTDSTGSSSSSCSCARLPERSEARCGLIVREAVYRLARAANFRVLGLRPFGPPLSLSNFPELLTPPVEGGSMDVPLTVNPDARVEQDASLAFGSDASSSGCVSGGRLSIATHRQS